MIYICSDIENEESKFRCKNTNQQYNQCCQDCIDRRFCNDKCDYSYDYDCMCKKENIL